MNIRDYSKEAIRTMASLNDSDKENLHMILGLTTEVGELADTYKKYLAYNKPIDTVNAQEEVGDIMWYIVNLCTLNGWDIEQIMDVNIAKLKARYPEKFTTEMATHRNLEEERKILEELGYREEKK
jgi:NTP pyrophosphatase (non-canonical NTP hydrolase)